MGWSRWYECKFEQNGELDRSNLYDAPRSRGIYAIATKTSWSYNVQYVGRSGSNIRGRLEAHFSGKPPRIKAGRSPKYKGNELIGDVVRMKRNTPGHPPDALYFAYLEIPEKDMDVIFESVYINSGEDERPIGNFVRGKSLPDGLREEDVINSPLEEDY